MRERDRLTRLATETGIVGAVVGLAVLVGPFGTYDDLAPLDRLQYWGVIVAFNWLQVRLIRGAMARVWGERRFWSITLAASAAAAVPATIEVLWLESLLRPAVASRLDFVPLYPQVLAVTVAVTVPVGRYLTARAAQPQTAPAVTPDDVGQLAGAGSDERREPALAPLLERLPPRLGRDVLCLQAEDHYIRVHTRLGDDLILHRFGDALAGLASADGLQVHRSWWVAHGAVEASVRRNRKVALRLVNGIEVPVSRSFMPAVRTAGWLDGPAPHRTEAAGRDPTG